MNENIMQHTAVFVHAVLIRLHFVTRCGLKILLPSYVLL